MLSQLVEVKEILILWCNFYLFIKRDIYPSFYLKKKKKEIYCIMLRRHNHSFTSQS